MKVLVVLTGGTIGSYKNDNVITTHDLNKSELISQYETRNPQHGIDFDSHHLCNILSENILSSDWSTIIEYIQTVDISSYDGIILTHGTDTLSYTANALDLTLNLAIPLVIVSAHLPLENSQSNALSNFSAAIACIKAKINSVLVAYQNPDENFVSIFTAREITQSLQLSSFFKAVDTLFASYEDEQLTVLKDITLSSNEEKVNARFNDNILLIKPHPGLAYDTFNLDTTEAVLHELYHSGTCHSNKLKPFIRQCKRTNTALFMVAISKSDVYYETTQELIDLGVHFLFDISVERALIKTMLAFDNFKDEDSRLQYLL